MTPVRQRVTKENPPPLIADLTLSRLAVTLGEMGFVEKDHTDLSDQPISGCIYLYRSFVPAPGRAARHCYVSLTSYEGHFLEAVIEEFEQPKTKKSGRAIPLVCRIERDPEAVLAMVGGS